MPKFPMLMFHKDHAKEGRLLHNEEQLKALPDPQDWHDTPAVFTDPNYVKPEPVDPTKPQPVFRRGKPAQRFPMHLYQKNDPDHPLTVLNQDALDTVDQNVWKDTPDPKAWVVVAPPVSDVADEDDVQTDSAPVKAVAVAPDVVLPPEKLTEAQIAQFYATSIGDIVPRLEVIEHPARLEELKAIEEKNPAGKRTTVIKAIASQLKLARNRVQVA